MAFRGYELNLMLRVQDRATTRLRRLSQDIGGINRAAQIQRDAARLSRNAISANARAEQAAAAGRLRGLNQASVAAQGLATNLNKAVAAGRLTAGEAQRVATAYDRIARSERMLQRSRLATHVGSVAAMGGGLGLAVAAGAANQFASFNREAVAAATQMRGVNESFTATVAISATLQTALLDLTRQFPATAQEMADSIYDIASGMDFQIDRTSRLTETQQRFNQSFKILNLANKVAVAGNLDLKTATDALITTFNNFNPTLRNPVETLNQLFAVVRFGKGTFAEFTPQFGRLASAANAAGQSLTEAGGALAFLSQRLPLSQATTALVRIFQIIGRKEFTTGFQELFKISPFEEGTRRLKTLSELMFIIERQGPKIWRGFTKGGVDLMNVLQNITAAGQNAMKGTTDAVGLQSTEFARRAITNFIVFGDQYRSTLEDVQSTQNEFVNSFKAFREQPGVQWQIAINQFKAFAIVIGQDVLPVVLRFIDFITRLSKRYEDLSPHTRALIAQFATWGSILLLVGGALVTVVGGIGILVARLGGLLATLGLSGNRGVVGRLSLMTRLLRGLMAIGTITIGIELLKKGDNSLWSTILGGAAQVGGAAFLGSKVAGWQGAAIAAGFAAYSIPLQMAAAEMKKQGIVSRKTVNDEIARIKAFQAAVAKTSGQTVAGRLAERARTILIRAVYRQEGLQGIKNTEKFMKGTLAKMQQDLVDYARATGMSHAFYQGHKAALQQFVKDNATATQSALDKWKQLASDLTGISLFGGMSSQAAQAAANIQLNLARAQASGSEPAIRRALQAQIASDKAQAARLENLPKTAARVKQLVELYNNIAASKSSLESMDKKSAKASQAETTAKNLAAEKARSRNEAQTEQTNKITQAADRLVQKYKELEEANKAAFQIFSGPISRGPIAQVYNNINQILTQFGRRPIAIPIKLQIQDITAQVQNFQRFVQDLNFLRQRGVPSELIKELQAKGPEEGLPIVEGLRNAGRGGINQYVKIWKEGQALIKTTTDQQMNQTLKEWKKYGKSIGWQIVQGLADDKTQATLRNGYKKYITDTFKGVLSDELSTAIAEKVTQYQTVQTAKRKKTGTKTTGTKSETTRATQSVTHNHNGDTVTVKADGATPAAVKAALDRHAFDKRHRR